MPRLASALACVAISLAPCWAQDAPKPAALRPHIVVFLADDLGHKDVGYHGSEIATPNIDKLATSGVRLEQFYVQPVCSPTRAALMTGRYPIRYGLQVGVIRPWASYGLPLEERLLPEALREVGYTTAICGKWHLGFHEPDYLPTARGFDHQYGHYLGAVDYNKHTRGVGVDWNRDDQPIDEEGYTTDLIAAECVKLIEGHAPDKPLFLYVPFNAPHTPLQAPADYLARYGEIRARRRRAFAAMVTCMDDAIGRVMTALERRGMRKNTLVIFASDNGGQTQAGADNRPLRGRKGSLYEGGVRVPALVAWPGVVPSLGTLDQPLHIVDLHATILALAGAKPPDPARPLDGRDAWDALRLRKPVPRDEILLNASPALSALRAGDWKLLERPTSGEPRYELYNVFEDPMERINRASQQPEKLAELKLRLARYTTAAVPPLGPAKRPADFEDPVRWRPGALPNTSPAKDQDQGTVPSAVRRQAAAAATRPNVILCMTDDQGYGDVGIQGHPVLKTPHLDAMAAGGLRFARFYAAAPVCSPTRGSCLTGRHPSRYGITGANVGHLPERETTLAELLQAEGYATGHFGKWHLGTLTRSERDSNRGGRPKSAAHYAPPWDHGFDVCFSTEAKVPTWDPMREPGTNRGYGTAYWNEYGERVTDNLEGDDSRVIMDRVIPFVRSAARNQRPFFAVVWLHSPHRPVVAGPDDLARYTDVADAEKRNYFACMTAMDAQIGRLRRTLRELGVAEDTMLWFCSDNGPEGDASAPGSTGPLRGRKRSLREGGVRVPALLEWPARISAAGVVDAPCSTSDYLPTVCDALDLPMPAGVEPIDGVSLLPMIEAGAVSRPRPIAFQHRRQRALIDGPYKILSVDEGATYALFDLVTDPQETDDLARREPERLQSMIDTLDVWMLSCEASRDADAAK